MGDRTLDKVAGNKVDQEVDVVTPLPAGTNNIGDVDVASIAAGNNNIGDVDVASIAAGSNRIGKITIRNAADGADIDPIAESTFTARIPTNGQKTMANSLPVTVSSDQSVLPTKTNAGDEVAVRQTVLDPVDDAGAVVQIKFALVNATADGDNTILAAVASKKIRVLAYSLSVSLTGTITVKSAATEKAKLSLTTGTPAPFAGSLYTPAFETGVNEALIVNNPAGVDTFGHITYIEV